MIEIFSIFFNSPTPSRFGEITAMWPYLSDESKIIFFLEKEKRPELRVICWLWNNLCLQALESKNPYIRYLAAKAYYFNFHMSKHLDEKVKEIIASDPENLVQNAHLEGKFSIDVPTEEDFEKLKFVNHQAKLSLVKNGQMRPIYFCKLVEFIIKNDNNLNNIKENEIYEIIYEYISSEKFAFYITDRLSNPYDQDQDIKSLWNLINILPERLADLLITKLPIEKPNEQDFFIINGILEKMTPKQIKILLNRNDLLLKELIKLSKTCKIKLLKDLLKCWMCHPVIIIAWCDHVCALNILCEDLQLEIKMKKQQIIKDMKDRRFKKDQIEKDQIRDLRIYALAREIMPWAKDKPESLDLIDSEDMHFLRERIIYGDTWSTYIAFREGWQSYHGENKDADHFLPKLI